MFVTLTAVPTESAAGQAARWVWSFPRCACARATLGALSVRRPGCNAGSLGSYGRPQRAGPAQSPPDQDSRERHRGVAPAPATSANYTMPRNTSSGADHFRAVANNDARRHLSASNQTPQHFNPTQAVCCCSRLVALARDEEGLHVLVLQDLHGCALGSVSLRHREERLLRLRHHRAREVVLVDRVILGRHGPVQEWHEVVKNARRIGVDEDDGRTVDSQEVELDGLDGLFLLADDLRVLHSASGIRASGCHDPAHTSASSL